MDFRAQLQAELPYLRRFARALTGDLALADDLVQDCVERALLKSGLYDPSRSMRPWLYAMLRNLHINGLRRGARSAVVKTVDELQSGEGATPPQQDQRISVAEIATALDLLPPQQREVLVLVGLEEMSYRETAEIVGVPIGTVMSRLSRARSGLKDILEKRGHTGLRRVK